MDRAAAAVHWTSRRAPRDRCRDAGSLVDILLHVAVAALYAAAAWVCRPGAGNGAAPGRENGLRAAAIGLALVVHALVIARTIVQGDALDLSFVNALSLVAGLAVLVA